MNVIRAFANQEFLKSDNPTAFTQRADVELQENKIVHDQKARVYYTKDGHFTAFNAETGKYITGYKLTSYQQDMYSESGIIGSTRPQTTKPDSINIQLQNKANDSIQKK